MAVIIPENFGKIKQIILNRAQIPGSAQPRNQELIESAINEYYMRIATERSWRWRTFDRVLNFDRASTIGTSSVTNGSKTVVIAGFTIDNTILWKTFRFDGTRELYRVVGLDTATNEIYLDGNYVGATNAAATHQIFKYEFALPPDLDTLDQVYIDSNGIINSGSKSGELDCLNNMEFNQLLSVASDIQDVPMCYTRDGDIPAEDLPPLNNMVMDYDFLGGESFDRVAKIRLFPINPDKNTLIHLHYTLLVNPLLDDNDKPLMPLDDRWILIHYVLGEWWKVQGAGGMADREFSIGDKMLAEMRQEYHQTDTKPKFVVDARRYMREHGFDNRKHLHYISRQLETGGL